MTDDFLSESASEIDVPAFARPPGQDEPDRNEHPGSRRSTKLLVTAVAGLGVTAWFIAAIVQGIELEGLWFELAVLLVFATASAYFPLQFAYKQELNFDLTVVVLAALLLPTHAAIFVCAIGYAVGYAIRYRLQIGLDCPFNAGIYAISLGITGLVLVAVDVDPVTNSPGFGEVIAIGAFASLLTLLVTRTLVALVISFESRQPFRQVLRDSTLGMQSAEQAMLGAMIALGIMGTILTNVYPLALLLLVVPAFALWLALKQNVETRHRIEASLATAQRVAGIGSLDWDLQHGDIRWSEILFHILGYEQGVQRPSADAYLERVNVDDRDRVRAAFNAAAEGRQVEIDHRIQLPAGESRSFNLKFNGVPDRSGKTRRIVGTIHDVTERKQLEDRLHFQAYHDSLTLLPNRAFFMRKLDQSFARYSRTSSIALLFLDLDRFKLVNDTMGHDAGDQLLRTISKRLESCLRPNDVVARLGGDEFIILLDAVESNEDILGVADRIIDSINKPVQLAGQRPIVISTSIGIVRPSRDHTSGADLLRDADTALYQAKEGGRNRIVMFDLAMGAATNERLMLEVDLRTAVERGELSLVYQPRVGLVSGKVHMVEALVRWAHPTRGDIPPAQFIPIAEETGLIDEIGRWIVRTAILEAKPWFTILNPAPTLSLNLTRKQIYDPDFADYVVGLLQPSGLNSSHVRLEVPEAILMADVEASIEALARLRVAGFGISIDDFGTGHSSLGSLRKFPVDMLQLDHQFVTEMGSNKEATAVTQAVIGLAHGLELTVLAEGIERPDQIDQLVKLGCELGQGMYFCSPLPAAELLAYLIRNQQMGVDRPRDQEPPNLRRLHR